MNSVTRVGIGLLAGVKTGKLTESRLFQDTVTCSISKSLGHPNQVWVSEVGHYLPVSGGGLRESSWDLDLSNQSLKLPPDRVRHVLEKGRWLSLGTTEPQPCPPVTVTFENTAFCSPTHAPRGF